MRRLLSDAEWAEALWDFEQSAFRLELQPSYLESDEEPHVRRFLAGDLTPPEWSDDWLDRVAAAVAGGKRIERVRVHEDPPTDYQRWLRWVSRENVKAGEVQRYLTRARADEIGLTPAVGCDDWWLLDSSKLIVMRFDPNGRRYQNEVITDPQRVEQACAWRDLAIHHSSPDTVRGQAA